MKKIKRIATMAIMFVYIFCISASFVGCNEMKTSTDGTFTFFRLGDYRFYGGDQEDSYVIVGATDELPKTVYIPAYYKGEEVVRIYYTDSSFVGGPGTAYGLDLKGVDKAYLPYACSLFEFRRYSSWSSFRPGRAKELYISRNFVNIPYEEYDDIAAYCYNDYDTDKYTVYFTPNTYDLFVEYDKGSCKEIDGVYWYGDAALKMANTAYMFNYKDCPNDGYFFINNFEYGTTIENTPYVPLRNGYTFSGWYKEPECINAWDFEADILPQAQYGEEGYELYQETKLYAKWIKK